MSDDIQDQIEQLNQQVLQLYQQGKYQEGIGLAVRAHDIARQHLAEDNPTFTSLLNNLGLLYRTVPAAGLSNR